MSDIAMIIGQRIRSYRVAKGLSQEKLAELSDCHPAYIGQIERGEKNVTIASIEKISCALGVPLSRIFEMLGAEENADSNIPLECYNFILEKTKKEQKRIYGILLEIDRYKTD